MNNMDYEQKKRIIRLSPSKLEALEVCPCYNRVITLEADSDGETAAQRGTRLHKVMETGDFKLCKEESEIEMCRKALLIVEGCAKSRTSAPTVMKETDLEVPELTYGTADWLAYWPDLKSCALYDYKFIRAEGTVSEPKDNLQLACYAAGVFNMLPEAEKVSVGLLAPQIDWFPEPYEYHRDDVPAIRARIERVIEHANDPFKRPLPCDMCATCANASRCPALGRTALAVAGNIGLVLPEAFAPEAIVSEADRAKGQVVARALANWSEQVIKYNNEFVKKGGSVPGHTVVRKQGNLRISDQDTVLEILRSDLTDNEIMSASRISLPKVVDLIAEKKSLPILETREMLLSKAADAIERGGDIVYLMRKKSVTDEQIMLGDSAAIAQTKLQLGE